MKKFYLLLMVCVFSCVAWSCSDNDDDDWDVPISISDLPISTQSFISTFYPGEKIVKVTKEIEHDILKYEVEFASGMEIEFDEYGDWTHIEAAKGHRIPTGVVPEISEYVGLHFGNMGIHEITYKYWGYEVELLDGTELLFASDFTFIGYDS